MVHVMHLLTWSRFLRLCPTRTIGHWKKISTTDIENFGTPSTDCWSLGSEILHLVRVKKMRTRRIFGRSVYDVWPRLIRSPDSDAESQTLWKGIVQQICHSITLLAAWQWLDSSTGIPAVDEPCASVGKGAEKCGGNCMSSTAFNRIPRWSWATCTRREQLRVKHVRNARGAACCLHNAHITIAKVARKITLVAIRMVQYTA